MSVSALLCSLSSFMLVGHWQECDFPSSSGRHGEFPLLVPPGRQKCSREKELGPSSPHPGNYKTSQQTQGLLCSTGASPLLFLLHSMILLCLQLNPSRTEGPKHQPLSPARRLIWDTVPGVTPQLLPGTEVSAHSPRAWLCPRAAGNAAHFSALNQLLEPRAAEKSTKMPKLSTL